eukprot:218310-Rhodomonas_salina.1
MLLSGVHSEDEPLGHTAHEIAEEVRPPQSSSASAVPSPVLKSVCCHQASKLTGEDFNKPPSPYDWKLLLG